MQIKANKLEHIFNKGTKTQFIALQDVDATLTQGEFIAIVGHSGSGKTTFVEHLNALLIPTGGDIEIGDIKIYGTKTIVGPKKTKVKKIRNRKIKNIKSIRRNVGVVFQFAEYQLFEETIEKDIIFGPINMGVKKTTALELAKKYLKIVELPDDYIHRSPFELSGGQKRRVALAGILAMEPDVLIFDEPTAGLDPEGCATMYKIFQDLNKQGKTIIVVTHDLDQVLKYTKRTIMFRNGRKVADGPTIDIMYDEDKIVKNSLKAPKIVNLVNKLEAKGKKIGKVIDIESLVGKLK